MPVLTPDDTDAQARADAASQAAEPADGRASRRWWARSWWAPRGRWGRLVAIVLAGALALGAVANLVVLRVTALPADAVLRTGDVTITQAELEQRTSVLVGLYGVQPPADGPARDRFERDVAQAVATSVVLDRAAAARHLEVPDATARQALDTIVAQKFGGDRGAFGQALGTLRVSEADVLSEIRRQLTASQLFTDVTRPSAPVTDADVAAAYEQRKAQLVTPERRQLRNIVVDAPDKAQGIAGQARGGAPVATLATASSLDRSTAAAGGDLGLLSADQLDKAVADAAFALPQGGIYGPVQTQYGWNVGQVEAIQPSQPLSLDQTRDQLRGQLTEERKLDLWRPWLTQQIRDAHVRYADRYRPAQPDALPSGIAG